MTQETVVSPADIVIAYKAMAATQEGQIVLQDLINKFGYARGSMYNPHEQHPQIAMTIAEGQRTVCVYIGNMIDSDPAMVENAGRSIMTEDEEYDIESLR